MSNATEFLLPTVRFAGHVLASAGGFILLAIVSLVPVYVVELLIWTGTGAEFVQLFHWIEIGVLYLDAGAYIVTVVIWTLVFVVEESQAAKKALGW